MSTAFDSLMSCADLTREHVVAALESRASTRALLGRLSRVARSGDSIDRVFLVLASLAGGYADWFDGDMRVEIEPRGDGTFIHTLVDLGSGQRERLFPSLSFDVPFHEVEEAISLSLSQLAPLEILPSAHGIVLSTLEDDGSWGDDRVFVDAASIDADATMGVVDAIPPSARPTPAPHATAPAPAETTKVLPSHTSTVPVPGQIPPAPQSSTPLILANRAPSTPAKAPDGARPTLRMKVVVPEAAKSEPPKPRPTLRAPATTRNEVAREQALHYMNERVDGLNPPTPKFVVSAELLAELRDDPGGPPGLDQDRDRDDEQAAESGEQIAKGLPAVGEGNRPPRR